MILQLRIKPSQGIALALLSFAAVSVSMAQTAKLTWQNPSTTNSFFYGLDVIDANTVFVGGNRDGQFLKTTNGGDDWTGITFDDGLYAVDFIDATTGWTVSDKGRVLKTTDGGTTFAELNTGTSNGRFWDVQFVTANKGWVVGKADDLPVILYTADGGNTWKKQNHDSFSANGFTSVFFLNENVGWVAGYEFEVYKTTNGGTTWTKQTATEPNQNFAFFTALEFLDELTGYAATTISGSNVRRIIKTVDGGITWTKPTQPALSYIGGVHFFDANNGIIAGGSGKILRTYNGGNTWTEIYAASGQETFLNMAFVNSNIGYAVGNAGLIVKTTDGGQTWTSLRKGVTSILRSLYFNSNEEGWVVGNTGTILHTTNAGTQWSNQPSGTTANLNKVFFTDHTTGWSVGDNGVILNTINQGQTWTPLLSRTKKTLRSVYFTDGQNGWAAGDTLGQVLVTNNGGTTWRFQPTGVDRILRAIHFENATHGWAVGDGGTILATTDGGASWSAQTTGTTQTLNAVVFVSASQGWAFGNLATILTTRDGGATWSAQESPIINENNDPYLPVDLFEAQFLNDSTGFAIGRQAVLLATSNAGKTWHIARNIAGTYNSIFFTTSNRGWMVGSSGTIVRYSQPPVIRDFTPEQAGRGEQITINGDGFMGTLEVTLGGVPLTYDVKSNGVIVATVPEGSITGKITVRTPEGIATSATDFTTLIATSTEDPEPANVSVYPNPSNSLVNIDLRVSRPGPLNLSIRDITGRLVDTTAYALSSGILTAQYNVANLPAGIYILEIQSGNTRTQRKLIVQK